MNTNPALEAKTMQAIEVTNPALFPRFKKTDLAMVDQSRMPSPGDEVIAEINGIQVAGDVLQIDGDLMTVEHCISGEVITLQWVPGVVTGRLRQPMAN